MYFSWSYKQHTISVNSKYAQNTPNTSNTYFQAAFVLDLNHVLAAALDLVLGHRAAPRIHSNGACRAVFGSRITIKCASHAQKVYRLLAHVRGITRIIAYTELQKAQRKRNFLTKLSCNTTANTQLLYTHQIHPGMYVPLRSSSSFLYFLRRVVSFLNCSARIS